MKAVLISIRPEWCAKIASGEKKIEVRKSRPKLTPPFKVYIYCTKDARKQFWTGPRYSYVDDHSHNAFDKCGSGKVISEFVCDRIDEIWKRGCPENFDYCYLSLNEWGNDDIAREINDVAAACLPKDQLSSYGAKVPRLYCWHISNLKIYDEPRELRQFVKPYDAKTCLNPTVVNCGDCKKCYFKHAPQSWCYMEETE